MAIANYSSSTTGFYLPTVKELLDLPILQHVKVICSKGLDHTVSGVFLSEIPDYYDWVGPGELVVTTCYALYDKPELLAAFIPRLTEIGASGVCIKPDRFLNGTIPDVIVSAAQKCGFPLIELPPEIRFSDITKAISDELLRRQTSALRSSLAVGELLTRTITDGASLNDIADVIRNITERSVLILDAVNQRRALSFTEADRHLYNDVDSPDFFSSILQNSAEHEMNAGKQSFGTLYLFGQNPGVSFRPEFLQQILLAIPLEISRYHSLHEDEEREFRDFFLHLLSDTIIDETAEQTRAGFLGLQLSQRHILLALRVRDSSREHTARETLFHRTVFFKSLWTIFKDLSLNPKLADMNGASLILLSIENADSDSDELLKTLCRKMNSCLTSHASLHILAGCSRVHPGIPGLIRCEQEAQLALRAASANPGNTIILFDDLGILNLLYAGNPEHEIKEYIKQTLKDLTNPEDDKTPDLLATLASFFQCMGNQRKMAEELYIHYNTVAYRLRHIEELTGKDFRNPQDRLQLELAIYLYRYFQYSDPNTLDP